MQLTHAWMHLRSAVPGDAGAGCGHQQRRPQRIRAARALRRHEPGHAHRAQRAAGQGGEGFPPFKMVPQVQARAGWHSLPSHTQAAVSQRCRDVVRHAERRKAHKGSLVVLEAPVGEPAGSAEAMEVDEGGRQASTR